MGEQQTLGSRIRSLRNKLDLSLRELAKRIEVSPAFLSDVEKDRRNPSDDKLRRIADELGVLFETLKALDRRVPVEQLRRRAEDEPTYGFALRQIADSDVSADELLEFLRRRNRSSGEQ